MKFIKFIKSQYYKITFDDSEQKEKYILFAFDKQDKINLTRKARVFPTIPMGIQIR